MHRRELLALASLASVAGSSGAIAQAPEPQREVRLIHIHSTPDGESHVGPVAVADTAGEIPVTGMVARVYARGVSSAPDWHTAPRRQFAINMTGTLEVEVSDGSRQEIGPGDLVYLSDVTGKGHVTRVLTPVTNLFIHVPADWDMLGWARGPGTN